MKITKSKLKQLIREELDMASLKSDDTAELSNKIAHQEYADEREAKLAQAEEGSEVLAEEKGAIITKIVDIVKKVAAKHGPDFIDMVVDKLKDEASMAMAGMGASVESADV